MGGGSGQGAWCRPGRAPGQHREAEGEWGPHGRRADPMGAERSLARRGAPPGPRGVGAHKALVGATPALRGVAPSPPRPLAHVGTVKQEDLDGGQVAQPREEQPGLPAPHPVLPAGPGGRAGRGCPAAPIPSATRRVERRRIAPGAGTGDGAKDGRRGGSAFGGRREAPCSCVQGRKGSRVVRATPSPARSWEGRRRLLAAAWLLRARGGRSDVALQPPLCYGEQRQRSPWLAVSSALRPSLPRAAREIL